MIEPGILFFVNAFVFDRGLHGHRGFTARIQPSTSRSHRTKDWCRILDPIYARL